MSARQGKAGGGAVAREVADASSVAFEGRTDAVSAGIAHDEGDAALSELKGRRAAALGRAARLRRASGTASRDAFGESDEELGTDALSRPASMASRPMLARARRASLATGRRDVRAARTGGEGRQGRHPAPSGPLEGADPPMAATTVQCARETKEGEAAPRTVASASEAPRRHGARSRLSALDGRAASRSGPPRTRRAARRGGRARSDAPTRMAAQGTAAGTTPAPADRAAAYAAGAPAAVPVAGILAGAVVAVLVAATLSQAIGSLFGFWDNEASRRASVEGLPPYVTYSMVLTALECQEEYGHPAGCTLAQIIVESGAGDNLCV